MEVCWSSFFYYRFQLIIAWNRAKKWSVRSSILTLEDDGNFNYSKVLARRFELGSVADPICYPHANQRLFRPHSHEGFSFEYLRYIRKYAHIMPRTYWSEHPFYQIIDGLKQQYRLGYRPEDLAHLETIEKKAWRKHEVHLQRLEQFPLDKAEYYLRLKQLHGVSIRGLSKITGEDYSYIGKVLRTLELPCEIKEFLEENKNDSDVVRFFNLKRLLEIVRQGEERLQMARFREFIEGV